jgi:prepilin-type N-terminal cleavage/methylation domain-containing protein
MMKQTTLTRFLHGFTLVEMAVVLVIIGLLLGGLLAPLSVQMETDRRKETQATLRAISEALIGYAQVNRRLPCPDFNNDGLDNDACSTSNTLPPPTGRLPYAALGISRTDAWNNWTYAVNGAFTSSATLTLATSGSGAGRIEVWSASNCTGTRLADNVPAVVVSGGKTALVGSPLEQENTDLDRCFTDAAYIIGGAGFDDLLTWLVPGVLFNRMVAAGVLP